MVLKLVMKSKFSIDCTKQLREGNNIFKIFFGVVEVLVKKFRYVSKLAISFYLSEVFCTNWMNPS